MRERAVQTGEAERHARSVPVRVPARPAAFLALAAAIGNRAAVQVARAESGAGGAGPAPAASQDQGADGGPGVPGFDAAGASDEQRLDEIRTRLGTGDPVRDIWRAFADLPEAANAHPDLWVPSAKRHPELARDEQVEAEFKERVEQLAHEGLAASHAAVDAEIQTLGVEHQFKPDADPEHLDAVAKLQQQAALLKEALRAKNALLNIPVGWKQPPAPDDPSKVPMNGPTQLLFDPGNPPPPESVTDDPALQPYDRVMKEYEPVEAVVAQAMNNPALFAIVEGGNGQKSEGAQRLLGIYNADTPAMAQLNLGLSLHEMLEKVEKATAAIGGSLDHRDLRPLHEKVTAEAPFSQPFERAVAQQAVADHDAMKTWIALGLTIPGAVALLLPGGAAIAGIVGALGSATQAALSWADYQRIKTAREARTGPGNDLVTQEQLDDAAIQAAVDAAFAFLDGVTAVSGAVRKAGGSVAELAQLAPTEREAVLADAMSTMGPGAAIEAAGGIDAVREAGAGGAGVRAQAYAAGVEDALSAHLGELPAEADLLPEAQRFVANYAGVGEPHALQTLLPQYTHPDELQKLIAKAKGRQVAAWVGKTADERAALALQDAVAKLPHPPQILLSTVLAKDTAHFDPKSWTIVVSVKSFMADTITEGELLYLKSIGIHEAEHGIQFFESAQFHIQTSANRTAAIAELKNRGLNSAAVDAAANAAPLDAAGVQRARPNFQEFLGTRAEWYEQVEKSVVGASERLKAAEAKHAAAQAVLRQLTDAGAHDAKAATAAAELSAAWKEMAYEKNTINSYLNRLEVEKGAFEAQRRYILEQEQRYAAEALANRRPYMDGLVTAGLLVAGAAIGGTVMYEVAIRPAQTPAHR
jgi:hypothetical protein